MKLANDKHERFCLEYARTANATESYRKVYKSKSSSQVLSQSASRLLKNEKVQARLKELYEEMASEKIASAAEMQEILTRIARQEQMEEVVVVEGVDKGVSEARIVKKRPSNADAIKAINQLARMQGVDNGGASINIVIPVIGGEDSLED